jgi:DNA-binding beta-propeller fold protein YncE
MNVKKLVMIMFALTIIFVFVTAFFVLKNSGILSFSKKVGGNRIVLEKIIYAPSKNPLRNPIDLAVTKDGKIFVTDSDHNRIQVFSSEGDFLFAFGKSGNKEGQFQSPVGIAADSHNYVYIADLYNQRISVFNQAGAFQYNISVTGASGQTSIPTAIAIDNKDKIYIIDRRDNTVKKINKNGEVLLSFGGLGKQNGQFEYPLGLCVDDKGRIIVSDTGNNRIQIFSQKGIFLKEMNVADGLPSGITTDLKNRIFITVPIQGKVMTSSLKELVLKDFIGDAKGSNEKLYFPEGIEYNNNKIYLTDKGNNRVLVYKLPRN